MLLAISSPFQTSVVVGGADGGQIVELQIAQRGDAPVGILEAAPLPQPGRFLEVLFISAGVGEVLKLTQTNDGFLFQNLLRNVSRDFLPGAKAKTR